MQIILRNLEWCPEKPLNVFIIHTLESNFRMRRWRRENATRLLRRIRHVIFNILFYEKINSRYRIVTFDNPLFSFLYLRSRRNLETKQTQSYLSSYFYRCPLDLYQLRVRFNTHQTANINSISVI